MEKASNIFRVLINNNDFMLFFWFFFSIPSMFWESIRLRSKVLSEEDLVEIDPKFKGIKSEYTAFGLFAIVVLLFLLTVVFPRFASWAMKTYERRFDPMLIFFFSGYGIYQAIFALRKGVYPMGKMLTFRYDDEKVIRRVAKEHILVSLVLFAGSVLFFFVFAQF